MRISTPLSSLVLLTVSLVRSAPTSTLNPLVEKLVNIEMSCQADNAHHEKVKLSFSDAYDMAKEGKGLQVEDVAFKNYFLEDEINITPNMYDSILTGGGKNKKFNVACVLKLNTVEECQGNIAFVKQREGDPEEKMYLCPMFFGIFPPDQSNPSQTDLHFSSKRWDESGWCTAPPHKLGNMMVAGRAPLHEMTHFKFIASKALGKMGAGGTFDITGVKDEKYPQLWVGWPPRIARTLKTRWEVFRKGMKGATQPPLRTIMNAESYAVAALEKTFAVRCKDKGFKPSQVAAVI